jgi:hypothetical protein
MCRDTAQAMWLLQLGALTTRVCDVHMHAPVSRPLCLLHLKQQALIVRGGDSLSGACLRRIDLSATKDRFEYSSVVIGLLLVRRWRSVLPTGLARQDRLRWCLGYQNEPI